MKSIALTFLITLPLLASDDDSFLIRGATVHPVASAEIQNGSVLVRDGKIVGVGRNLAAPKGTRIIEGKGLHVYPGMVDSATEMGLSEIGSVRETVDVGEIGKFDPQLHAEVAINPSSEHIPVTRANGITSVIALPMSAGGEGFRRGGGGSIITGQAALVHLDGWTWEEMEIKKSAGMGMHFPIIPTMNGRFGALPPEFGGGRTYTDEKKNYDTELRELKEFFENARRYQKAKAAATASHDKNFPIDLKYEAMLPVLEGAEPLIVMASQASALSAMRCSSPINKKCA